MGIFSTVKNLLTSKDSTARSVSSDNFIPEYTQSSGEKIFLTRNCVPNMPKMETMFFVHFSLNPRASEMINKRLELMKSVVGNATLPKGVNKSDDSGSLISAVTSSIKNVTKTLSNLASKFTSKKSKKKTSEENTSTPSAYPDYIPDAEIMNSLSFELSKSIIDITKPNISFTIKEYNEYNRKRLCYDGLKYQPLSITFYDLKENPVQQFFFAYLKMINNDFFIKDYQHFNKQIVTDDFDNDITAWGFDTDSNFRLIDKISVCEYYMNKMMVYTYENPVLESIDFGKGAVGSYNPNKITVKFQYEGLTNDLLDVRPYNVEWSIDKVQLKSMINSDIPGEMATFLNKRYKKGESVGIDTAVSFIKGILDAPKGQKWSVFKSQALNTASKLGYSKQITTIKSAVSAVSNYKKSDNKSKYLLKLADDPTSIVGQVVGGSSSSDSSNYLKKFI